MDLDQIVIPNGSWELLEGQKMAFDFQLWHRLPEVTLNDIHIGLIALTRVYVTDSDTEGMDFVDLTGYVETEPFDVKTATPRIFRHDFKADQTYEWKTKEEKQS